MLYNYLKIAWKVLFRKKSFTFISLFGVSFTLAVLMVLIAFLDMELSSHAPETKRDHMVYMDRMMQKRVVIDTVMNRDTIFAENGNVMRIDSFETTAENTQSVSTGGVGYYFIDKYLRKLKSPKAMTVLIEDYPTSVYTDDLKLSLSPMYVDDVYWQIYDFEFLAGQPFGKTAIEQGSKVVVLNQSTAEKIFGDIQSAIDQTIQLNESTYQVVGVVNNVPKSYEFTYADIYRPITTLGERLYRKSFGGGASAILLADSPEGRQQIISEYEAMAPQIPVEDENYTEFKLRGTTHVEKYAYKFVSETKATGVVTTFFSFIVGFMFLFILLPTLNLVNINVSRILERASEIGVRKAFGARQGDLVNQFLVENVVLTLCGGLLGMLMAGGIMYWINNDESILLPYAQLHFNWRVFAISLGVCLLFGLLSGVLPAWRMSKMHIIKALKA